MLLLDLGGVTDPAYMPREHVIRYDDTRRNHASGLLVINPAPFLEGTRWARGGGVSVIVFSLTLDPWEIPLVLLFGSFLSLPLVCDDLILARHR